MRKCLVADCSNKYAAKGYCHFHYNRVKRHGDPSVCLKQKNRKCSVDGCEKKYEGNGFCNSHNWRLKRHGDAMKKFSRSMSVKERLLSSANTNDKGVCWEWMKRINNHGYGSIGVNGKTRLAHRVSFETFNFTIPNGLIVCHKCDNKKCINPEHLFLGTHKDNTQDMIKKCRQRPPEGQEHWHFNGKHKLRIVDVIKIKEQLSKGVSAVKISSEFNVTASSIYGIKSNKTWRHVRG